MQIKKYNYYLGKSAQLSINKGKKYNAKGGLISDKNFNTTSKLPLANIEYIYIDYALSESTSVVLFDSNGVPLLSAPIESIQNKSLFAVPSGIHSIAFSLAANDYTNSLVETCFIYVVKECEPVYSKIAKENKKEQDQQYFTSKISGSVSFFNSDYNYIDSIANKYIFIIEDSAKKLLGTAPFNKTECEIDTLEKKITVNLQSNDIYSLVKSKWSTRYNILEALPAITPIESTKRPVIQLYTLGATTATSFVGNNFIETEVSEQKTSISAAKAYGFFLASHLCELEIKDCPIQEANGIYAGNLETGLLYLSTDNSYYLRPNRPGSTLGTHLYLVKKENGADTYLYRSSHIVAQNNTQDGVTYWNYGTQDFGMIGADDVTTMEVVFSVQVPIYYYVVARVLADKSYSSVFPLGLVPPNDFINTGYNYKRYIKYDDSPSSVGAFVDIQLSGKSLSEPTPYGKNDYNKYFIYDTTKILNSNKPMAPIGKSQWANASIWAYPSALYDTDILENCATTYTIEDCISISAVLKALIQKTGLPITHAGTSEYSRFLYDRTWPGDIGSLQESKFNVFVSQRTNILKANYNQPAKKLEVSLKEILDELALLFKCYWFIDSNNRLRIEHISYFMQGNSYSATSVIGFDLTTMEDQFNKKAFAYAQQKVSFDSDAFASSYKFTWPAIAFEQFNIDKLAFYDSYLLESNAKEITSNIFTSDISVMLLQPESFSDDGLVLLCPLLSVVKGYYLPIKTFIVKKKSKVENLEYPVSTLNGLASWNNLIYFYMWDMPGQYINPENLIGSLASDGANIIYPVNIKSLKRCMTQKDIVFMPESDFSVNSKIKTYIGEGSIEQLSVNIDTGLATATVSYEPA